MYCTAVSMSYSPSTLIHTILPIALAIDYLTFFEVFIFLTGISKKRIRKKKLLDIY